MVVSNEKQRKNEESILEFTESVLQSQLRKRSIGVAIQECVHRDNKKQDIGSGYFPYLLQLTSYTYLRSVAL